MKPAQQNICENTS